MDTNVNVVIQEMVEKRAMLLSEIGISQGEVDNLNEAIKAIDDSDPDVDLTEYGLNRIQTLGSIGADAVPVLKAKGLHDAVIVSEKINSKRVNEYLESGELKEKDIEEFRGKGKDYLKAMKGSK